MAERTAAFYRDVLDGTADSVRTGLARLVEHAIDLSDERHAAFAGAWKIVRHGNGLAYHVGTSAGSSLRLTLPSRHRRLVFRFMRNPWSGVACLETGGRRDYCDLYAPENGGAVAWRVALPVAPDTDETTCTLALEVSTNPRADGCEMWLERVAAGEAAE